MTAIFFPKLDKLVTLVIDVERFCYAGVYENTIIFDCLLLFYSKQLKQLSVVYEDIIPSGCLGAPNLVELDISESILHQKELGCPDVEKCTIKSGGELHSYDIACIQRLFPKLVCLGFKFCSPKKIMSQFTALPVTALSNIRILELEDCGKVSILFLSFFPNVHHLKLKLKVDPKNLYGPWVYITKFWNHDNPYDSKEFWKRYPNITLVTVEYICKQETKKDSTLHLYSRRGFIDYWDKRIPT